MPGIFFVCCGVIFANCVRRRLAGNLLSNRRSSASGFIALRRDGLSSKYTLSRRSFSEDGSPRGSSAKPARRCDIAPDFGLVGWLLRLVLR